MSLKYISYKLDRPKYDVIECRQRGLSYSAALKVIFRLDIINIDEDTGDKIGQDARVEEVYLGDIPLMTRVKLQDIITNRYLEPSPRALVRKYNKQIA